jgi:hypothetical protein
VNTSKAEFLTAPDYRAHFAGPREIKLKLTGANNVADVLLVDQFQITDQKRDSFTFLDIILVVGGDDLTVQDAEFTDALGVVQTHSRIDEIKARITTGWTLVWMGVEG